MAAKFLVNENGVAPQIVATEKDEMQFIVLGRVNFDSNKWQLSDDAKRLLDNIYAYLHAKPGVKRLLLEGHTDSAGGMKFNETLSDKRVMAVQDYMVSKGIDPTLIRWKGVSERAPVDENLTRPGDIRNRQVELYLHNLLFYFPIQEEPSGT